MTLSVTLRDDGGEVVVPLSDLETFHDKDHFGGLVLAMKVLQRAFAVFPESGVPHRDELVIVTGLNAPGIVDAFDATTRATSRRRLIFDPKLPHGPPSPFGRFAFEVHRPCGAVALWLREGLLPADFAETGRIVEAGLGDAAAIARWHGYKRAVGEALVPMPPADVLELARIDSGRFL